MYNNLVQYSRKWSSCESEEVGDVASSWETGGAGRETRLYVLE